MTVETTERHQCPDGHRHGETITCYRDHRCRCVACRNRNATRKAESEARNPKPSKPTKRRVKQAGGTHVPGFYGAITVRDEDSLKVAQLIAKHVPTGDRAQVASMLGVSACES